MTYKLDGMAFILGKHSGWFRRATTVEESGLNQMFSGESPAKSNVAGPAAIQQGTTIRDGNQCDQIGCDSG